eukprot:TRINITY_DN32781_c0_g1_i1.p1 TRINITY_DN32781_c0_g1~~TRINITY_DN32781_c0_g1_i1.p1  ORF type:complete len:1896 (-),score=226.58 TRINITY_DN32781_c0_g1_i1:426-5957(-)
MDAAPFNVDGLGSIAGSPAIALHRGVDSLARDMTTKELSAENGDVHKSMEIFRKQVDGFDIRVLVRVASESSGVQEKEISDLVHRLLCSYSAGGFPHPWISVPKEADGANSDCGRLFAHDTAFASVLECPPALMRMKSCPVRAEPPPLFPSVVTQTQSEFVFQLACSAPSMRTERASIRGEFRKHIVTLLLAGITRSLFSAARVNKTIDFLIENRQRLTQVLQAGELDDVHAILKLLPLESSLSASPSSLTTPPASVIEAVTFTAPPPTCPICFDAIDSPDLIELPCPERHRFCRSCLRQHVDVVTFPRCPQVRCQYELTEEDVLAACGQSQRLSDFQQMTLRRAIESIHGHVECPNPACANFVICNVERRTCVACECGWPPFCSVCRQAFHFHAECSAVQPLRSRWLQWINQGRSDYQGDVEVFSEAVAKHQVVVRQAFARHKELEVDEAWKVENCRICPHCFRIVQKVSGCNHMVCGRGNGDGDKQPGCGASFDWTQAPHYQPRVERCKELPELDFAGSKLLGAGVKHFFVTCSLCHKSIRGPRFRCIHCEAFDCCVDCERFLSEAHTIDHVFEIILKPVETINEDLPVGSEVEIFGMEGNASVLNGIVAKICRYFPELQAYDLDLPFGGQPIVPAANVQPAGVDSADAAQEMLEKALSQQEARRYHLGLKRGQRVQLSKDCGARKRIERSLAIVERYSTYGEWDYELKLESPVQWACRRCTLLNDNAHTRCVACDDPREVQVNVFVAASLVEPLIVEAGDVKELAQRHWAEKERLSMVAAANERGRGCYLNLPVDTSVHTNDGGLWKVVCYDPCRKVFKLSDATNHVRIEPAVGLRAVFYDAKKPLQAVEECLRRHAICEATQKLATCWHDGMLANVFLGLPTSQRVAILWKLEEGDTSVPASSTAESASRYQDLHRVCLPSTAVTRSSKLVRPVAEDEFATVMMYLPATGSYLVKSREDSISWGSEDPAADAEALVVMHNLEVARLRAAEVQKKEVAGCNLDLRPDQWVEDRSSGARSRVLAYDAWCRCYKLVDGSAVPVDRVIAIFSSESSPLEAAEQVRRRHDAEATRLEEVAVANRKVPEGTLAMPPMSTLEVQHGENAGRWTVERFYRERSVYSVRLWPGDCHSRRVCRELPASCVRAVFWTHRMPSVAASDATALHEAERERLDACELAEALVARCRLGLPKGHLVYLICEICRVVRYIPQISAYVVSPLAYDFPVKIVGTDEVRPCLLDADDPRAEAEGLSRRHEEECMRLASVKVANDAVKDGGILALRPGTEVKLIGEGMLRRPKEEHYGLGVVRKYSKTRRTYQVFLEHEDWGANVSSALDPINVGFQHVAPVFWEEPDPADALKQILMEHGVERQRRSLVRESLGNCVGANLNLPKAMLVRLRSDQTLPLSADDSWQVSMYNKPTQTYMLTKSQPFVVEHRVPAADVSPLLWEADDPAAEASLAIFAHAAEVQRVDEAAACAKEAANMTMSLPAGFLVRLLRPITVDHDPARKSTSFKLTDLLRRLPHRKAGDFAYVFSAFARGSCIISFPDGDNFHAGDDRQGTRRKVSSAHQRAASSTCTDATPEAFLPGAFDVRHLSILPRTEISDATAFRPDFSLCDEPRVAFEQLRRRHEWMVAAQTKLEELQSSLPVGLLDMPVDTRIIADGKVGVTTVYRGGFKPAYRVRLLASSECVVFAPDQLRPAVETELAIAEIGRRHSAEVARRLDVHQANALAASFPRGNLPVGAHVEYSLNPRAAEGRGLAQFHQGHILSLSADVDNVQFYDVFREPELTVTSVCSDSIVRVRRDATFPVFWSSPRPMEDVSELAAAVYEQQQKDSVTNPCEYRD